MHSISYSFRFIRSYNTCNLMHIHSTYEITCIVSGEVKCVVGNKTFNAVQGDYIVCHPNVPHMYTTEKSSETWTMLFSSDFVPTFDNVIVGKVGNNCVFRCSDAVASYVNSCIQCESNDLLEIKSYLYALLSQYLSQTELVENTLFNRDVVMEITKYITENYKEKITIKDVADHIGYNCNYASKLFKRIFGMSFNDFVNTLRINTACQLLVNTNSKIVQIAFDSGFQSQRSFNQNFKKAFGVSPDEYRMNFQVQRFYRQ